VPLNTPSRNIFGYAPALSSFAVLPLTFTDAWSVVLHKLMGSYVVFAESSLI